MTRISKKKIILANPNTKTQLIPPRIITIIRKGLTIFLNRKKYQLEASGSPLIVIFLDWSFLANIFIPYEKQIVPINIPITNWLSVLHSEEKYPFILGNLKFEIKKYKM